MNRSKNYNTCRVLEEEIGHNDIGNSFFFSFSQIVLTSSLFLLPFSLSEKVTLAQNELQNAILNCRYYYYICLK